MAERSAPVCPSACLRLRLLLTSVRPRQGQRPDALCAGLQEHLSEWFAFEKPVGGIFVWAVARSPGLDTDRLLSAALEAGVCVAPSSVFDASGQNRRALRLNFTLNPPDRLAEGVRRLATALRALEGLD
jgi:2-aminoadipate transaminase